MLTEQNIDLKRKIDDLKFESSKASPVSSPQRASSKARPERRDDGITEVGLLNRLKNYPKRNLLAVIGLYYVLRLRFTDRSGALSHDQKPFSLGQFADYSTDKHGVSRKLAVLRDAGLIEFEMGGRGRKGEMRLTRTLPTDA